MAGGIGAAESYRINVGWASPDDPSGEKLKAEYYPGDVGFDPLGLKPDDPAEFRLMQEKELAHCRIASTLDRRANSRALNAIHAPV